MDLDKMKALWIKANDAYNNTGKPMMPDAEFDRLEAAIRKKDPTWSKLKATGARVNKKVEVKLPCFMPSLGKAYPEKILSFLTKYQGPYIVMDKLDGSSLFCEYEKGKPSRLITRGDGERGGDISFLIPHLTLPKKIKLMDKLQLRFEAVMDESVFQKKWSRKAKGEDGFDNSRNMVNGILNRMKPHPALKDIRFYTLGVFGLNIKTGLSHAKALGFDVVHYKLMGNMEFSPSKFLKDRMANGDIAIDGIVIAPTSFRYEYSNSDKPKGIVAYKENDELNATEAVVEDVIYQVSGFGRITPKLKIKPTEIGGVMVKHATLHNAQWMIDRKIGVGSKVRLVRSGGVIPKVVGVNPVNKGKLKYPDQEYKLKGVHFVMTKMTKTQACKIIERFVKVLGIDFLAIKSIESLYDAAITTPERLIRFATRCPNTIEILVNAGFGPNQSVKIVKELQRVLLSPIPLVKLMVACGTFDSGVGNRKLDKLVEGLDFKKLLALDTEESIVAEIIKVHGFKETSASVIAEGILEFKEWLDRVSEYVRIEQPKRKVKVTKGVLSGMTFAWTTYRNKDEEAFITSLGGEVGSFTSKTNWLFYSQSGKQSSKVDKAGDKAITFADFKKKMKL